MRLAYRRNPLAYPGGRNPGYDPTHIAASPNIRYSGIPGAGGAFINLLNGQPAAKSGSPATVQTPIGPAVNFPSGTSQYNAASNSYSETISTFTIAAIVIPAASVSGTSLFSTTNTATGARIALELNSLVFSYYDQGGSNSSSFPALSIGTPYFLAVSGKSGAQNFILVNLVTGQILQATTAGGVTSESNGATWGIGGLSTGASSQTQLAAVMYSLQYFKMPQLLAWAQSPWDFWYPPTAFDAALSMLRGSSLGFTVTATILTAIEAAASLRASMVAAEENEASLRPILYSPVEPSASLATDTLISAEFGAGLKPAVVAPSALGTSLCVTPQSPIDLGATLKAIASAVAESGASVKQCIISPPNSGASLRGSIAVPTTWSASLAPTEQVDIEWTGTAATVIGTISSPIEFGSRIASQISATLEIGHGAVVNIRAPVEWWGTVTNWEPTQRFGSAFWPVIYGAIVAASAPGAVFPTVSYGIVAPSGMSPMSQQLTDFPNMVAGLQAQTLWVDFGKFLPSGVALSGAPTLSIANGSYSAGKDSSPSSRLTGGPTIGTISTALGGTGLTNTALLFQLSDLQPNVTYLLTYACGRSDGSDVVAGFNHVYAQSPG